MFVDQAFEQRCADKSCDPSNGFFGKTVVVDQRAVPVGYVGRMSTDGNHRLFVDYRREVLQQGLDCGSILSCGNRLGNFGAEAVAAGNCEQRPPPGRRRQ